MGLKVGELYAELDLDNGPFDRKLGMAGQGLGGLGKVAGVAGLAIAGGLAVGAVKSLQAYAEFETGMNEVFTLLPGITQPAMDQMADQAKNLATEFGIMPDEVVPALYQAISAGVPPDNVFDFMETAAMAAKAGVTDLETAVDGITTAVNAYGSEALSAEEASDLMFTAVKGGKTTFEELSSSLFNVTPIAAALGVEFGDVTAAMAAMTSQGIPTSVASTQLRQMFVELSQEGTKVSDVFTEIAGKSFQDFIAEGNNVQDALKLLEEYAANTDVNINDLFGSVEAGAAALALTGAGTEKFSKELEAAAGAAGSTKEAYDQMAQGVQEAWNRIKARGQVALIEIGDAIAPYAERAMEAVLVEFDKLPAWWDEHGEDIKAAFEDVGDAMWDLAKVGKESFETLTENWNEFVLAVELTAPALVGAFTSIKVNSLLAGIGLGSMAGPVGLLAGAFANLALWAYILWTRWESIKQTVMDNTWIQVAVSWFSMFSLVFNPLILAVTVAIGVIKEFGGAWEYVKGIAIGAVTGMLIAVMMGWEMLKMATQIAWQVIVSTIQGAWDFISSIVTTAVNTVVNTATTAWNAVSSATSSVWSTISSTISSAISGIISAVSSGFSSVVSTIAGAMASAASAVSSGVSKIVSFISGLPGKITSALGNLGSLLTSAGEALMSGLLDGIKSAWESVRDYLSGLAGEIQSLKGPIEKDRKLLIPQGQAIMEGLLRGVDSMDGALRKTFSGITTQIHTYQPATAAASGSTSHTTINLYGGMSFPGVRNGNDVESFLSEVAKKAQIKAASNLTGHELRAS